MKKQLLSALVTATLVVMAAPAALAQNVAIVNGKAIPKSRLDAMAQQMAQQMARAGRPANPEMQGQLREAAIAREIFAQEAQARGLDATENYKTQMDLARQAILINELVADFQSKNPVTDAEAQAEYDRYAAANGGQEFRARHILVEKEDEAKAIIAQLKKGAKFDVIAKKSSKDVGSGAKGGDLDWANPGTYVKEFAEALTTLGKGKTTETPVKTQFGYHVIRVDDVRSAQMPKFDEVKPQIIQQLTQQKAAKFQEDLRAKAKIE